MQTEMVCIRPVFSEPTCVCAENIWSKKLFCLQSVWALLFYFNSDTGSNKLHQQVLQIDSQASPRNSFFRSSISFQLAMSMSHNSNCEAETH